MVTATILTLFKANIQWRRPTSFVVSFVLALNSVNIVAFTTILVLHVGVMGQYFPRHLGFMFSRRSGNVQEEGPGGLALRAGDLGGLSAAPGQRGGLGNGHEYVK